MNTAPFDTAAVGYDATFTDQPLGRILRSAVWRHLGAQFREGDRVMDLGCGTGVDALWLAGRGVEVLGLDASQCMIEVASLKVGSSFQSASFKQFDLSSPDDWQQFQGNNGIPFQGAYSNFGALNCVRDRRAFGRSLAPLIEPGGRLVLVLMGPFCPWEWVWFGARLQWRAATRRWRSGESAFIGERSSLPVYYPGPATLKRELAPYFSHRLTEGIGVLLPPTFATSVIEHRPRLLDRLLRWEKWAASSLPGQWLNDHYLSVFERVDS
jgi:SAM-dependent methyltransferase